MHIQANSLRILDRTTPLYSVANKEAKADSQYKTYRIEEESR